MAGTLRFHCGPRVQSLLGNEDPASLSVQQKKKKEELKEIIPVFPPLTDDNASLGITPDERFVP